MPASSISTSFCPNDWAERFKCADVEELSSMLDAFENYYLLHKQRKAFVLSLLTHRRPNRESWVLFNQSGVSSQPWIAFIDESSCIWTPSPTGTYFFPVANVAKSTLLMWEIPEGIFPKLTNQYFVHQYENKNKT